MTERLALFVPNQPFDGGEYHYVECGLDYVYLMNGFALEDHPEYGRLVSFRDVPDLHKAIGLHVVQQNSRGLTPAEFKYLRKQMKITQAELARRFGVDPQTIANYEKSATPIPKTTDRLLRLDFLLYIMPEDVRVDFLKSATAEAGTESRRDQRSSDRRQIVHQWEERFEMCPA